MTDEEVARGDAGHRELAHLLDLIRELTAGASFVASPADLFVRTFGILAGPVPFDVAAAVMLEQNLDLFVSTRAGGESLVNEQLVARIRGALVSLIPVSFDSTEVVVRSEVHDLPTGGEGMGLTHEAFTLLAQERRTAGMLYISRADPPFTESEQAILAICATQLSLLLDMIHARTRIQNLADTDDLTGIWNRRYFRRQLPSEVERSRTFNVPLSLILFDIDDFKQINDGFGHVIGDVVLSELTGAVRETLRPTDTLARFGGDEFAIILPHTDLQRAVIVAGRLLERVGSLTIPTDEEGAIRCSISIGIAQFRSDDATAGDLIRRADEKLYASKRQGKNRYTA